MRAVPFALRSGGVSPNEPAPPGGGPDHRPARGTVSSLLEELAQAPEVTPGSGIAPGAVIGGRFEVLRELGRGGFGLVFEARDRELGRLVAVKVVRPRRGVIPSALRAEAEAAAQLHHPNIVTIHDLGSAGDEGWIVLELLRGETLEERLRRGLLAPGEALRIATEVARGLAHAHRAGVVHRDLKPSNVFLCDDGAVKILDFGLSRVFGSGSGPEGGTPAYMAPEQWRREADDERADVFALGVMLHEMLAGSRPFAVEAGRSAALDDGPVPEVPAAAAPRALRGLVRRMISRAPADRPRDGAAVLESLLAAGAAQESRRGWRRLALAAAAAGLVALLALAGARALRNREPPPGQRIPVAVADFQNATSDPELNGLSGMLTTSLEQSRRLTVLTRSRLVDLLRQMGREVPERIDEPLAREVGKVAGVKALLLATVHRFDELYAIEMRALDPVSNEYLFTLKADGKGKASIPGMIDRLSAQTRERLRERPGDVARERPVADVTTANLAAYEHFFRARQAIDLWRPDEGRSELEAALRIDPGFALARYQRAVLDAWTPVWVKASKTGDEASLRIMRDHIADAMKLADRLPEKERLALLAWKATVDGQWDEAKRLRDQAATAYPEDKEAVFWAGDVRFHRAEWEAALPYFERALKLDPSYVLALNHLTLLNDTLGRPRDELAAARRWAEVAQSPESHRFAGRALLSLDRRDEAEQEFRKATEPEGRPWPPAELVQWFLYQRRPHHAEQLARDGLAAAARAPGPASPDAEHWNDAVAYRRLVVSALVQQGRIREAREAVDDAAHAGIPAQDAIRLRQGLGTSIRSAADVHRALADAEAAGLLKGARPLLGAALSLAAAGDAGAAVGYAARAQAEPDWAEVDPMQRSLYEGVAAMRAGRHAEAEATLRAVAARPDVNSRYLGQMLLGEALLAAGKDGEGAAVLEQALAMPWSGAIDARSFFDPGALLQLARSEERAGERARAREHVDELVRLWQRADADYAPAVEAKAMKKRLAAATAQATQR